MDIKKVITTYGWDVKSLADAMGVSRISMSRSVNSTPRLATLRKIAETIGCNVSEFFEDENDDAPAPFMDTVPVDTPKPYIREYLRLMGITQTELARKMGKSLAYISALVTHKSSASISMLGEIAKLIGIPFWQLFVLPDPSSKTLQPVYLVYKGEMYSASSLQDVVEIASRLEKQ